MPASDRRASSSSPLRLRGAHRLAGPLRLCLCLWLGLAATACGGGGGGASLYAPAPETVAEPAGPGRLLGVTGLPPVGARQVTAALAALEGAAPALVPRHDVANYRLEYLTTDAGGREVRASGLVAVPIKGAGARSPVLAWQHGTIFRDAEAPSNDIRGDAAPLVLASLGYLVVAADYVGYGASRGTPHPYLLAAPTAAAVVDLLTAARTWRLRNGVVGNGQLFLAGYSEGGYATLAAHRGIEAEASVHRAELVTVVPGAGPYDVAATLDGLLERVKDEFPVLGDFLDPGVLRHLSAATRADVRRLLLRALIPGNADVVFDTRFIDAYFEDDRDRIERQSSVHDWKPSVRVRLMHGRDDRTVPYASATSTRDAMRACGAGDVTLTDCTAVPADHLPCVVPYVDFLVRTLGEHARNL